MISTTKKIIFYIITADIEIQSFKTKEFNVVARKILNL